MADPTKADVVQELYRRRSSFTPEQASQLDEVVRRMISSGEIRGAPAPTPAVPEPPPPGFGERLYQTTVEPVAETFKHPITAATETFKTAWGWPQLQDIGRQVQGGNWGAAGVGALDYMRKGPGGRLAEPMTAPIIEDVRTGNWGGAAGGALGTGLSLLGPEFVPKVLPRLPGRGAVRAGERPAVPSKPRFELPETAAGKLQSKLEAGVRETPWSSLDDVETAAKAGDGNAAEVLRQIENAGDVPGRIEQASINLEDFRSSQEANRLYSSVDEIAKNAGAGDIPLTRSSVVLDKTLGGLAAAKVRDPALIGLLEGIRKRITPATRLQSGNTYGLMRELVSDLGERIREKHTGENALIGERGVAQLQMLKEAIESDIQKWTAQSKSPGLQKAAEAADRYYREVRVPFKDRAIAAAGSTTEADTIFKSFIKAGRADRAQKFYDALDKKGQAAVQYQLVTKAMLDATDPVKGFDSGAFVRSMDKMKDSAGVFFQGSDKMALDGLRNFALHAAKVDQLPLGQAAMVAASAGYGMGQLGIPGAAAIGAGAAGALGLAKALLQFEGGRKFLYAASSLKPGSPAMTDLLRRAAKSQAQGLQTYLRTRRDAQEPANRPPLEDFVIRY